MKIYFMGICGAGMGNVALMMQTLGHSVSGTDANVYPPMSDTLKNNDVSLYEGYDVERLKQLNPDAVIVGNAMKRGNPEIEYLLETRSIPFISMSDLLSQEILSKRHNIVITGTHGKTTTTALTAFLLKNQGQDPGYFIGGVPNDFPQGAHVGSTEAPFVIEGDEYDSAFFDKRSKFIHYQPNILVINNLEFDHADIFRDLTAIKQSFSHVLKIVPRNGYVIVNGEDQNTNELVQSIWSPLIRVGTGDDNDLKIANFKERENSSAFDLIWKGQLWDHVTTKLPGIYNARNIAMAAIAAGMSMNLENPTALSLSQLDQFIGVKRRQEFIYRSENLLVIDDFAHHPTAVKEVLISLRERFPEHTLTACFEPRSNTACINIHQETLKEALSIADTALIALIHRRELIPEEKRLNTDLIIQQLPDGKAFHDYESLYAELLLRESSIPQQIVCFFTNGSLGGIMQRWVNALENAVPACS